MRTILHVAFLSLYISIYSILHPTTPNRILECERNFRAHPESKESARCFYDLREPDPSMSIAKLSELSRDFPNATWANFYLALMKWNDVDSENLLRAAAVRFTAQGDGDGAIEAYYNLYTKAMGRNLEEAALEVRHAMDAAALKTTSPTHRAQAQLLQATHLWMVGRSLGIADELLKMAE